MITLTSILTIVNLVIALGIVVGGYIAIRTGISKSVTEIQERVKQGLHDENELLQQRVRRMETEVFQLQGVLETIIDTFKDEGIFIAYDGERVTIKDTRMPNAVRHIVKRTTKKSPAVKKAEEP